MSSMKPELPEDTFPCKDCVLIVQRKDTGNIMEISDSMDTLLICEGVEVTKREPIRKVSPGCRYCRGYFYYEMNLSRGGYLNELIIG
jgi:hypothetical protein